MIALDQLTLARVRPTVGSTYALDLGEYGALDLTLVAAEGYGVPAASDGAAREPF